MNELYNDSNILLGVNIDHVATVRNARGTPYPDPVHAAFAAEQGGADGITVHLREDRRHIVDRDVRLLAESLQIPMNLEMAVTDEMLTIAEDIRPPHCCLVPEKREELTTEGGLDVAGQISRLREAVGRLQATGARVSLFIDPDERQLDAAAEVGAPVVEIHTGRYADAVDRDTAHKEYLRIVQAARHAERLGLIVHGGHGLNYHNVQPVAAIPQMRELNIGHAIVSEAIWVGLAEAVAKMKRLMKDARRT